MKGNFGHERKCWFLWFSQHNPRTLAETEPTKLSVDSWVPYCWNYSFFIYDLSRIIFQWSPLCTIYLLIILSGSLEISNFIFRGIFWRDVQSFNIWNNYSSTSDRQRETSHIFSWGLLFCPVFFLLILLFFTILSYNAHTHTHCVCYILIILWRNVLFLQILKCFQVVLSKFVSTKGCNCNSKLKPFKLLVLLTALLERSKNKENISISSKCD